MSLDRVASVDRRVMLALPTDALQGAFEGGTDYSAFLLKLGIFIVTFAATYFVGRLVAVPLADRLLDRDEVTPTVRRPAQKFVRVAIIFVAFFSGLFFARLETLLSVTGSLAAALTLAIGFASRDVIGNLVSGLFIISDPKFNIGDWIEWADNEGIIEDISFRVTRVRTFKNELITVPNSMLATSIVTNHAINDRLRLDFTLSVGLDADVDAVREICREEAAANPLLLDDPEPIVDVDSITAAGVDLVARVWIADPSRRKYLTVRSEYVRAVTDRLDDAGIELSADLLEVTGDVGGGDRAAIDEDRTASAVEDRATSGDEKRTVDGDRATDEE